MGKQPGIMLYFEMRGGLQRLTQAEKGDLLDAILCYGEEGAEPLLQGTAAVVWDLIKPRIQRDREKYETLCRHRREMAEKRWENKGKEARSDAWMKKYL